MNWPRDWLHTIFVPNTHERIRMAHNVQSSAVDEIFREVFEMKEKVFYLIQKISCKRFHFS